MMLFLKITSILCIYILVHRRKDEVYPLLILETLRKSNLLLRSRHYTDKATIAMNCRLSSLLIFLTELKTAPDTTLNYVDKTRRIKKSSPPQRGEKISAENRNLQFTEEVSWFLATGIGYTYISLLQIGAKHLQNSFCNNLFIFF